MFKPNEAARRHPNGNALLVQGSGFDLRNDEKLPNENKLVSIKYFGNNLD